MADKTGMINDGNGIGIMSQVRVYLRARLPNIMMGEVYDHEAWGVPGPMSFIDERFQTIHDAIVIEPEDLDLHPCRIKIPAQYPPEDTNVVYGMYDPRTDHTFYVGQTKNLYKRMQQHCLVSRNLDRAGLSIGVQMLNDLKIEIFDAGHYVRCPVLAICGESYIADIVEAALIKAYRNTVFNTAIKYTFPWDE